MQMEYDRPNVILPMYIQPGVLLTPIRIMG